MNKYSEHGEEPNITIKPELQILFDNLKIPTKITERKINTKIQFAKSLIEAVTPNFKPDSTCAKKLMSIKKHYPLSITPSA